VAETRTERFYRQSSSQRRRCTRQGAQGCGGVKRNSRIGCCQLEHRQRGRQRGRGPAQPRQIGQATQRGQPLTIAIRGQYDDDGDGYGEVIFERKSVEAEAPSDIIERLQLGFQALAALSEFYQTSGIPGSCLWTQKGIPRS
jgi:hypothetical protein